MMFTGRGTSATRNVDGHGEKPSRAAGRFRNWRVCPTAEAGPTIPRTTPCRLLTVRRDHTRPRPGPMEALP